jgi:hypothetical protein
MSKSRPVRPRFSAVPLSKMKKGDPFRWDIGENFEVQHCGDCVRLIGPRCEMALGTAEVHKLRDLLTIFCTYPSDRQHAEAIDRFNNCPYDDEYFTKLREAQFVRWKT